MKLTTWDFDSLPPPRQGGYFAQTIEFSHISSLYDFTKTYLPVALAPQLEVEKAYICNKNNIFAIYKERELEGIYALLMFNSEGLRKLLSNEFDPQLVDCASLATESEAPAAIYKWAVAAPGAGIAAVQCMSQVLRHSEYARTDLYARPVTPIGRRMTDKFGFKPALTADPLLQRYVRAANRHTRLMQAA